MPSEYVGDCGIGDLPHEEWLVSECLRWGIDYLRLTVGEPTGFTLEVRWRDHDLGTLPCIGVSWNHEAARPPNGFMWKWERALKTFDEAIDWAALHPGVVSSRLEKEWAELRDDDDE